MAAITPAQVQQSQAPCSCQPTEAAVRLLSSAEAAAALSTRAAVGPAGPIRIATAGPYCWVRLTCDRHRTLERYLACCSPSMVAGAAAKVQERKLIEGKCIACSRY